MRRFAPILTAAALAIAALVAPGAGGVARAATAPGHHKLALRHHMTAEVVSVNADAKTVTVKKNGRHGRDYTFNAADGVHVAALKTGEHVRVTYVKSGADRIAEKIVPSSRTAKK